MSKIQKCQGNLVNDPSEKHVVSIMLQIPILHWKYWLHTFLSILGRNDLEDILLVGYIGQLLKWQMKNPGILVVKVATTLLITKKIIINI